MRVEALDARNLMTAGLGLEAPVDTDGPGVDQPVEIGLTARDTAFRNTAAG